MPGLRVLLLGGAGIISSACSWLAVERGGSRQRIDTWVDALSDKLAQAWRPGG
jgi:hypothetical protein